MNRRQLYLATRAALGIGFILLIAGLALLVTSLAGHHNGTAIFGGVLAVVGFVLMFGALRLDPRQQWEKDAHVGPSAADAVARVQSRRNTGESRVELDRERAERDRPPEDW
jgi:membrane protein implicated in regulation of membrane protease activity